MEQEPKEPSREELEARANEVLIELYRLKEQCYDRVSPQLQQEWYYAELAADGAQDLAPWIAECERVLVSIKEELGKLEG